MNGFIGEMNVSEMHTEGLLNWLKILTQFEETKFSFFYGEKDIKMITNQKRPDIDEVKSELKKRGKL